MSFHLIVGPQDICDALDCKWCDVMKKRFKYAKNQHKDSSNGSAFQLDVNAPEFVPVVCGDKLCPDESVHARTKMDPVLIYSTECPVEVRQSLKEVMVMTLLICGWHLGQ